MTFRSTFKIWIFTVGIAGLLFGCAAANAPVRPIDAARYSEDKAFFLAELARVAGPDATNCGLYRPAIESDSPGIVCVRSAWSTHHAFVVAREYREGYCPNLVGYAADGEGHVYLVQSCPDRDHVDGRRLRPSVFLCSDYRPPLRQYGDGTCSVLDGL
jgi:hypothetical protein